MEVIRNVGSPPLVRERHEGAASVRDPLGITPARAGKTGKFGCGVPNYQDHPRSCGKDLHNSPARNDFPGSPPLVRERRVCRRGNAERAGITPARAGKTFDVRKKAFLRRDHPRSCGKDKWYRRFIGKELGSPPLVRERRRVAVVGGVGQGITPARAGKTVMDPFICAISLLPVFKIYLISFQSISTLQLLRNLGGC